MIDLEQWITIFGITLNLLISSHDLMELYQSPASLNISSSPSGAWHYSSGQNIFDMMTIKCASLDQPTTYHSYLSSLHKNLTAQKLLAILYLMTPNLFLCKTNSNLG